MKRYLLLVILLCGGVLTNAQGIVTITGVINNTQDDSIKIFFNNSRLVYEPMEFATPLDDGKFEYKAKVKEKYTTLTITHGKLSSELMVMADDELELTATVVNDSTWSLIYKGKGSDRANFMAAHARDLGPLEKYPQKLFGMLGADVKSFLLIVRQEEKKEFDYIEKNKGKLSPDFVRYIQQSVVYFSYFGRFQYPYMHEVALSKSYNFSSIPPVNYEAVANIPPAFNDSFMSAASYRLFAEQYYRMQLEVGKYFNDSTHAFRVQDSIVKLAVKTMPDQTAQYVIALHLYAIIRSIPLDTAADRINKFKKRWPSSEYIKDLDAQYAIAKRIAPGTKAYDFTFTTPQGKTGKLSDFNGKVVLLAFWTSADRQSLMDMRAAAQMANKYPDITFLYVSLDTEDEPWIKTIEQHKLQGIHTRENGSWKSLLAQMYGIQSMPTFFLIDRNGRFALKETPRPSQAAKMKAEVEKLLFQAPFINSSGK